MAWTVAIVSIARSVQVGEAPGSPVNSSAVQFSASSELTQIVRLLHYLSEALYSLQLRMQYVAFFFIARKAYHVTSSAIFHSDLCNKATIRSKIVASIADESYTPPRQLNTVIRQIIDSKVGIRFNSV